MGQPVTVTSRDGITRTYPSGKLAAKEWPTGTLTLRRGAFFERKTKRVKRPPRQAPRPFDKREHDQQELFIDEMYVDLR